jgi:SAM-dependent methyltransferase
LAGHRDAIRWDTKYGAGFEPSFRPHPLAGQALGLAVPDGPVLDLACGPSGSALLAAEAGRRVVAVDISATALDLLAGEAGRRGLDGLVELVHADLERWRPEPAGFALVLCTGYWDRHLFGPAADAVQPGGLLGWDALTALALRSRPGMPAQWCLGDGEPASLLPAGWSVLSQEDQPSGMRRRLLARRES